MKLTTKSYMLFCIAVAVMALPVQAAEVPAVVRVLFQNWKSQLQVEPVYESIIDDDAGNIAIRKLSAEKAGSAGGPGVKVTIDELLLGNVSDRGSGLYEIGSLTASQAKVEITATQGAIFTVTTPKTTAESLFVKDAGENPAPEDALRAAMNVAKKVTSGPIAREGNGYKVTADAYQSTWDGDPVTGAGNFTGKLANVVIPELAVAALDPQGSLKKLGYSGLTFDIEGGGKLDIAGGKMGGTVNFAYIGKEMGTLRFSAGASDIPVAVYGELQKARASGREPDFNALMPELQNVLFSGFTFRFEDNSITKKVLPMLAASQGVDEPTLIASWGAMLQLSLMQLKNQAFTDQVVSAVSNFLKDPHSITLTLKPQTPLKVQELMTLNPAAPGDAITKLGVSVTAND